MAQISDRGELQNHGGDKGAGRKEHVGALDVCGGSMLDGLKRWEEVVSLVEKTRRRVALWMDGFDRWLRRLILGGRSL